MLAAEIRAKPLQMLVFAWSGRLMPDFKHDFQANPEALLIQRLRAFAAAAARAEGRFEQRKCQPAAE